MKQNKNKNFFFHRICNIPKFNMIASNNLSRFNFDDFPSNASSCFFGLLFLAKSFKLRASARGWPQQENAFPGEGRKPRTSNPTGLQSLRRLHRLKVQASFEDTLKVHLWAMQEENHHTVQNIQILLKFVRSCLMRKQTKKKLFRDDSFLFYRAAQSEDASTSAESSDEEVDHTERISEKPPSLQELGRKSSMPLPLSTSLPAPTCSTVSDILAKSPTFTPNNVQRFTTVLVAFVIRVLNDFFILIAPRLLLVILISSSLATTS